MSGPTAGDGGSHRSGFVAVAGLPNAGKSTLVNQLVGSHVAIVSARPQTTRRTIRAIVNRDDLQVVLVDLPGSQRPLDRLTARMQRSVEAELGEVDAILWVVDVTARSGPAEQAVAHMVFARDLPVVVALNKCDAAKPHVIARRIEQLAAIIGDRDYHALVPVSASTGDATDTLLGELAALLPPGPPLYPAGMASDLRDDERIAEYLREAALPHLRQELPHALGVEVDEIEQGDDDLLVIYANLLVESDSQVGIVVGSGGERIRQVGTDARRRIESELGCRVHLDLRVKVRRDWRNSDAELDRMGI